MYNVASLQIDYREAPAAQIVVDYANLQALLQYLTGLQSLKLRLPVKSLELGPLHHLTDLQTLDLSWCYDIPDIGPYSS